MLMQLSPGYSAARPHHQGPSSPTRSESCGRRMNGCLMERRCAAQSGSSRQDSPPTRAVEWTWQLPRGKGVPRSDDPSANSCVKGNDRCARRSHVPLLLVPANAVGSVKRRADAERSIDAIVQAAIDLCKTDRSFNMAALAREAGVSRVTLYAHFPTKQAVLERAVVTALAETQKAMIGFDLRGQAPGAALVELIERQWATLNHYRRLYLAAAETLPADMLRSLHDPVFGQVEKLVRRGRREGDFRTDLPLRWQVSMIYALMHQAAAEVAAQRLPDKTAGELIAKTVLAALAA
jgi:TetR/AcrR family transcriptional regulator, mexCD-oprJ operon repressor